MKTVTIRKMFFAWNMEKEKLFLEEKAREGLLLQKASLGKYVFEVTEPQDMVYQFDFQMISKDDLDEYLSMFGDWELVVRYGGWFYFRKLRDDKSNEIFSDVSSVRSMYLRLLGFLALVGFPLYYQLLILFPRIREEGVSTFYNWFMPFSYIITLLHMYALVKILLAVKRLNNITD